MEYEIGKVYIAKDGRPVRYMGGDPLDKANWQDIKEDAPAPKAAPRRGAPNPDELSADGIKALASGIPFTDELRSVIGSIPSLLPGGKTFRESYQEHQAAEEADLGRIREESPIMSRVAQTVGAAPLAAAPLQAGIRAVQAGKGLLGGAKAAGAVGAVEGGLMGAGEATGGIKDRVKGGTIGAAIGGPIGVLLSAIPGGRNVRSRPVAGRGARAADELRDATGIKQGVNEALDVTEDQLETVRNQYYRPFERRYTAIEDPALLSQLRAEDVLPHTRSVSKEVADGTRPPSFKEAQEIWQQLRKVGRNSPAHARYADNVNDALESAVPGFRDANQVYAAAIAPKQALIQGRKFWNKSAEDIEREMRGLAGDELTNFRVGQLHEMLRRLEQRDEAAGAVLRRFMDAGPETERIMRSLFPDEGGYRQFQRSLREEESADLAREQLKRLGGAASLLAKYAAAGAAGAAGFEGARRLLE